jgi:transcription termination factor Rho
VKNLEKKTVAELRKMAKKANIGGYSKMRKEELIQSLSKRSRGKKNIWRNVRGITKFAVEPPPVEYFDYSDTDILPDALSVEECYEAEEEAEEE